ncbi:MAG: PAS domain-containing sensor histidine kinase, partial [Beijerinckiaceae bacterium]|nr:PAS domain-containing sensor histidine kinase [Beijerinckiaceae bacterium]
IKIESGPGVGTSVTIKLPLDCRQVKAGSPSSAVIEAIPLPAAKAGPADFSLGQSNYPVEKEVRKIA